jgi:hypothetical protein
VDGFGLCAASSKEGRPALPLELRFVVCLYRAISGLLLTEGNGGAVVVSKRKMSAIFEGQ